jgi:large subunit ribosomal protein L3
MKFIIGKKLGMTTIYDPEKGALNVTLIECFPNSVTQVRSTQKDGYEAVQVSAANPKFEAKKGKGKTKKNLRIKECKESIEGVKEGDVLDTSQFAVGDVVKVSGIMKGKGFQGVMKRHGFKGSPKSHGHKHDWRAPGSIGSSFPEHVLKGKRMAGRMGGVRRTTRGLKVVMVDAQEAIIAVKGAVPGAKGNLVEVQAIK